MCIKSRIFASSNENINPKKYKKMKNLFIITLTIYNVKTSETSTINYYYQSYANAYKKLKEYEKKCTDFTTFAADWKYNSVILRIENLED